jgi:HK97 family phage portal protein
MKLNTLAVALYLKAAVSRVLSIRDPAHWRNREHDSPTGERVTSQSVLGLSAVWACVNLLAGTISSLPLMVYRTDAKGARTVARDHPLYRVLHDSPNSLQTSVDFWDFASASLELWGNAYARVARSGDRVVALVPLMPDLPVVERAGPGRLVYRWTEDGRSYEEPSDRILHIRGFGGNPLGGMSTLAFGARAFGLALAIDKAAGATFANGLRSQIAINFKDVLAHDQRTQLYDLLERKYQGAMNSGRPFITEGGAGVQVLSMNPDDAQMLESRGFSVDEICRFFGVPPFMIGHTEKSTSWGTGLAEQVLGFQKFTLRRRLKRIEQALEQQLLTPEDRAAGIVIEFNLEGLLRGDSGARSTFYQSALNNGWMTINEVRALENMPPVDGGDVPRMQSQNVPITEAGRQPETALPARSEAS